MFSKGFSHTLQWVCWSWLQLTVSGTGQPWPLLTEATLQPPTTKTLSCTPFVYHVYIVLDTEGPNGSVYSLVRYMLS